MFKLIRFDFLDGIPVYVYKPDDMGPDPAIFVYYHGGGMVIGSRDGVDTTCKTISM